MQTSNYRGFQIERKWNGFRIIEKEAAWPETYATVSDAQKSIDFELKGRK
jgi:hypothetical protein